MTSIGTNSINVTKASAHSLLGPRGDVAAIDDAREIMALDGLGFWEGPDTRREALDHGSRLLIGTIG